MVIAKEEWFKNKSGSFFDVKMPWQGYVYLLCLCSVMFLGVFLLPDTLISTIIVGAIFMFLLFDMFYAQLKSMDERSKAHYSIAMRNMSWGMIVTLVMTSIILEGLGIMNIGILIMTTGVVGAIISIITRYKLEKEN